MDYFSLIDATVRHGLANAAFNAPDENAIAVAAALPALATLVGCDLPCTTRERIDTHLRGRQEEVRFIDGIGHARPMYAGIAVRTWLRAGDQPQRVQHFVNSAQPLLASFVDDDRPLFAASSRDAVIALFAAAVVLATDESDPLALSAFEKAFRSQQPDGTFLHRTASDNPEPSWYDELAILHALSTTPPRNDRWTTAIQRSVAYHAAEVQPDHASSHPFAIHAFLSHPDGIPLADMMLHSAGVQQPATMDAVSLLLLGDALHCSGRLRAR